MPRLPLTRTDFNTPKGALLGIISAAYNLGAVFALPLVPYINDRYGRRWSIFLGSWIMVVASLIQALSVSGMSNPQFCCQNTANDLLKRACTL
jgi:MFS family permease